VNNETHLEFGRKVAEGCVWAYRESPLGIMPEFFHMMKCSSLSNCTWDAVRWFSERNSDNVPPGFASIDDSRYILRPEAIESVFYLYRITGDPKWQEYAWEMFSAIERYTRTELANAAIEDVIQDPPVQMDSMESFWMAETLKYLYLVFSEPDLVSLDEYVFNTEAHPFRRPQ
jgi:mannosyl-oligosaccharide alpha-1,2-mannosidase